MEIDKYKPIDFKNYKPCFITKIGYRIDSCLAIYKQVGFKETVLYMYRMIKINIFRFRYKHCKRHRKRIQSTFTADRLWAFMIFDMFMQKKTFDIKEIMKILPEAEKEKWKEPAITSINKSIEQFNITEEEQIARLYEIYGLTYNKQ